MAQEIPESLKQLLAAMLVGAIGRELTEEEAAEHRKTCMGCAAAYAEEQKTKVEVNAAINAPYKKFDEGTAMGEAGVGTASFGTAGFTAKRVPIGYAAFLKGPHGERMIPGSFNSDQGKVEDRRTAFADAPYFQLMLQVAGPLSIEIKPVYTE